MTQHNRILVLGSSAGGGDWPPLVAAALALKEAGHETRYIGDERLVESTLGTGLTVEPVPPDLDLGPRLRSWVAELEENPEASLPLPGWVDDMTPFALEVAESQSPDLLLCSDFTSFLGVRVREKTGTPMCLVNATYYRGPNAPRPFEEDFAPGPETQEVLEAMHTSGDLVLHATDPEFDPPPVTPPPNHHWIGPLLWEPQSPRPHWLEEPGDPWALVTLSSEQQEREIELAQAAIRALDGFPLRTLVTLGDPNRLEELDLPAGNARVETFVPHSPVLQRASLCVSHAGHGIVSKALRFGVPMVLVPWGRDQPGVAARAEALGVARVVPRSSLTPETLAEAVHTVLTTPEYATSAREHARRMRAQDPPDRARRLIDDFLKA